MSWGKILAGVAGAAVAGAAIFYLREKSVETPPHDTEESDGAFEIRTYPALLVAETSQTGGRDRALGNGFGVLADYIFGDARGPGDTGAALAMTAPVLATPAARGWIIRFVMPAAATRATLPVPAEGVRITELPARRMAVLRFGGRADDAALAAREAELRAWLDSRGLTPMGKVEHGFYNSPLMPGPLRHNEVMFQISQT